MMRNTFARGFTLIELMVTVAIAAVLMVVAVPSLTTFKRNAELTSATNTLLAAINAARGEAMKRGRYAMVVPVDGANWSNGWIVFVDMDGSKAYNAATDVTVLTQPALPSYFTISGNGTTIGDVAPYIRYDPSGFTKTLGSSFPGNSTLTLTRNDLTGSDLLNQTRRIIIAPTGRTRTCKPANTSDSTCAIGSGTGN